MFISIRKPMIKKCLECWKEYKTSRDYSKFCCFDCKIKHKRLKDIPCAVCWKMFHPSKSTVKTCSKECWYKSMALWDRKCEYCWKMFTPEHSTNRFCSRECWRKVNTFLKEIPCPICWKEFKPRTSKTVCCSMRCWQIYNWNNKSEEDKKASIERLVNSNPDTISKTNVSYAELLMSYWYDIEIEFALGRRSYDLKIWDILIEINPFAYHSSNWAPKKWKIKPKSPMYHYYKAKYAIEHWYKIIEFWVDRMSNEELFYLLENLKETKLDTPQIHRYHRKTKEHFAGDWYNDEEMTKKWYVKIYDAWEQYIFNSTTLN